MVEEFSISEFIDQYSGRSEAQTFINDRVGVANDQIATANTYLENTIGKLLDPVSDIDTSTGTTETCDVSLSLNENAFDGVVLTEAPDVRLNPIGNIGDIEANWDINQNLDLPIKPLLRDINTDGLSSDNKPEPFNVSDELDVEITYQPAGYVSGLLEFIQDKVRAALNAIDEIDLIDANPNVALDGNVGDVAIVDTAIEQAIYDRAVSRLENEEAIAIEKTEATFQSRGFALPAGALSANIAAIHAAGLRAREDLSNDVLRSSVELEQKRTEYDLQKGSQITDAQAKYDSARVALEGLNMEYLKTVAGNRAIYIESAVKLEDVMSRIYETEEKLKLEAQKETVASIVSVFNSRVNGYKQLMEAYKIEADSTIATINAEVAYNRGMIDLYLAEMSGAKSIIDIEKLKIDGTKVQAEISEIKTKAEIDALRIENERMATTASIYESEVRAYAASIGGLKEIETLKVQAYSAEVQGRGTEIASQASVATAEIQAIIQKAAVEVEALKAQASLSSSIVSSALNSINMSASYGFSGSSGYSRSSQPPTVDYRYSGKVSSDVPAAT